MAESPISGIQTLLGLHPSSEPLTRFIDSIQSKVHNCERFEPEVKVFTDVVYLNHYALGLSMMFKPITGYKPVKGLDLSELDKSRLLLDEIDIYNSSQSDSNSKDPSSRNSGPGFSRFPSFVVLEVGGNTDGSGDERKDRSAQFLVTNESSGKDFVSCYGEPDRKGGGSGPSSGSIGIWCEWTKDGIMVEFGGVEARGPQAWERGKDAVWKVIQIFSKPNGQI